MSQENQAHSTKVPTSRSSRSVGHSFQIFFANATAFLPTDSPWARVAAKDSEKWNFNYVLCHTGRWREIVGCSFRVAKQYPGAVFSQDLAPLTLRSSGARAAWHRFSRLLYYHSCWLSHLHTWPAFDESPFLDFCIKDIYSHYVK